ncbi:hypothetical protein IIE18_21910 [Pseudomonas sp. V1]|uniref:RHS repeat domain-containing protein n=1 Tax=Pseudomonas arcuscaelestis TaxID=2710591 RepID=UPI00193FD92D|nr:hypothetical protein [Pseudomonas arcuscaelestis]MBM3107786.1 hypothetical protein [Pseudomonas arcuscaelestis]
MTGNIQETSSIPVQPNNVGALHTQANNFLQSVQSGVDPRTGQFNLAINVPLGPANDMAGPSMSLTWGFSSLSSHLDQGFGLGWSLLVSALSIDQDTWSLRLSSGEQFAVYLNGTELGFHDYKLKAIRIILENDNAFRVEHKSGEIEILRLIDNRGSHYVLHELRSPEGRRLKLHWSSANDINYLDSITDESGRTLATFDYPNTQLILEPDYPGLTSTIQFLMANDQLAGLQLPCIDTPFDFKYESIIVGDDDQALLFPSEITGPLGAKDDVSWSRYLDTSHQLPDGAPIDFLPRVITWTHSDGVNESTLQRTYEWSGTENFLGYGSQQGFKWEAGRDSLYWLIEDYKYSCTETQHDVNGVPLATISRTWDRHHLQVLEVTLYGQCETTVQTTYGVDYAKPWDEQIAQCQLPHLVSTTYTDRKTNAQRTEHTEYEYDEYGNPLSTRYPSGVMETREYYSSSGEEKGCPFDASGMVRFLKCLTVAPAPDQPGAAPTLSTRYEYQDLPSLIDGDPNHAVVNREELKDRTAGQVLETTDQTYELTDKQHYGRQKQVVTTLGGKGTITEFEYRIETIEGQPLLWTAVTIKGFENDRLAQSTTSDARSMITGLTSCEISAAGVRTEYSYDLLGRVTRAVIAARTDYQAVRTCAYHLDDTFVRSYAPSVASAHNPTQLQVRVGLEETDATGQRKRSWLDGSGRVVLVQVENIDGPSGTSEEPPVFFDIAANVYDAQGRVTQETSWDWCHGQEKPLTTMITRVEYDDWGRRKKQISPTGVISHSLHDPIALRTEHWLESPNGALGSKQITFSNVAASPLREALYDAQGQLVRTTHLTRDGLDRVVEKCVQPAQGKVITTCYEYDAYSRVIRKTLPDATEIVWTYLGHSDGDHPESISLVAPADETKAEV